MLKTINAHQCETSIQRFDSRSYLAERFYTQQKCIQRSHLEANLILYLFCFFLLVKERQTFLKVTGLVRAEVHYPPPKFPVCDKVHKE